jgi:hypothetical protein
MKIPLCAANAHINPVYNQYTRNRRNAQAEIRENAAGKRIDAVRREEREIPEKALSGGCKAAVRCV